MLFLHFVIVVVYEQLLITYVYSISFYGVKNL